MKTSKIQLAIQQLEAEVAVLNLAIARLKATEKATETKRATKKKEPTL